MFAYWGRRGALTQLTLGAGRAALAECHVEPTICVSRQNEAIDEFRKFGSHLFEIDTFSSNVGAALGSWRIPHLRRLLRERLRRDRTQVVVELMPHVWSPFLMPYLRNGDTSYVAVVHDAVRHPGDHTGWIGSLAKQTLRRADAVVTLSSAVTEQIVEERLASRERVRQTFLPDLDIGARRAIVPPRKPFRLLFLGRIKPYKGLPLFLDAVEALRAGGIPVDVGVYGMGALGASAERLKRMQAEVVNRWLTIPEIAEILPRFDAVVLSHIEASQSGIVSIAFAAGVPVIATPVGALPEQVRDGSTGMIAARCDAPALADAAKRLLLDEKIYLATCQNIVRFAEKRSMATFVNKLVSHAFAVATARSAYSSRSHGSDFQFDQPAVEQLSN
jgi:glycosyltransferase involved in cell wall biosynthesis